jgi:hypothetical protein
MVKSNLDGISVIKVYYIKVINITIKSFVQLMYAIIFLIINF